jgi:hypothetical protein
MVSVLGQSLESLHDVLLLRVAPFCVHALLVRRGRASQLVPLAYAALVALAALRGAPHAVLLSPALGLCALLAAALVMHAATVGVARGALPRLAFACLAAAVATVVPGFVLPAGVALTVQFLGWELMLKGYSLATESERVRRAPVLGESLFFLLVTPLLVYVPAEPRCPSPHLERLGAARIASGSAFLALQFALYAGTSALLSAAFGASALALAVAATVLRILVEYCAHAGLASVQIGFMRLLGYPLEERYDRPLAALNPADFWRRWNTYVGRWAQRYVMTPVARAARRHGLASAGSASALGLLAAFACVGLLHDYATFVSRAVLTPGATTMFVLQGALVLASIRAERSARRRPSAGWALGARRLRFGLVLVASAWFALPALAGEGTFAALRDLGF